MSSGVQVCRGVVYGRPVRDGSTVVTKLKEHLIRKPVVQLTGKEAKHSMTLNENLSLSAVSNQV